MTMTPYCVVTVGCFSVLSRLFGWTSKRKQALLLLGQSALCVPDTAERNVTAALFILQKNTIHYNMVLDEYNIVLTNYNSVLISYDIVLISYSFSSEAASTVIPLTADCKRKCSATPCTTSSKLRSIM